MSKVDQSVVLAGVRMKNPVVVASGTFGFGREYGRFYDLSELWFPYAENRKSSR